jgi:hypothetical protein
MTEEKDSHKTTKGLINMLNNMEHHYVGGARTFLHGNPTQPLGERSYRQLMARIEGLEADLRSVRGAIGKLRTIAEKRNYKDITKVIEEDIYEDGFEKNKVQ